MKTLQKYILDNLSVLFLSIFVPLFSIASVIFLIKMATYTSVIQLDVFEMGKLFIFVIPEILFYTLPFSFFIAVSLTLFKLSNENEIIVLFSLGIHPSFIIKTLLKPAAVLSTLLLLDFLILFPHAKTLSHNFYLYKKGEAQFNLSASEFGHSFGEWLLYIGHDNENETYDDIFLFKKNTKENEEVLISAKHAKIITDSNILKLELIDGEGYSYSKEKFSQINFDKMYINDYLTTKLVKYEAPLEYWQSDIKKKKKRKLLIRNTLLSLLPVLSLFIAASIGIVHIRHNKGKIYLYLFLSVAAYYELVLLLQKSIQYYAIPTMIIAWSIITYYIYKKMIVEKF